MCAACLPPSHLHHQQVMVEHFWKQLRTTLTSVDEPKYAKVTHKEFQDMLSKFHTKSQA